MTRRPALAPCTASDDTSRAASRSGRTPCRRGRPGRALWDRLSAAATVGDVKRTKTVQAGRLAQLVLLVCTALGLALMHTLGHSTTGHSHSSSMGHDESLTAVIVGAPGEAVHDGCTGDCPHGSAPTHHGGGMTGWQICLAVLGGLAAVVLLAVLMFVGRRTPLQVPPRHHWSRLVQRAPPSSFGLATARVSVLRI